MASFHKYYSFFKPELQQFDTGPILNNFELLVSELNKYQDISSADKNQVKTIINAFLNKKHPGIPEMARELNKCIENLYSLNNASINSLVETFVRNYQEEYKAVTRTLPSFLNFK